MHCIQYLQCCIAGWTVLSHPWLETSRYCGQQEMVVLSQYC